MPYKKVTIAIFFLVTIVGVVSFISGKLLKGQRAEVSGTIYDFKIKSIDGKSVDFSSFKGKNILIVNTASKCGYTYQYKDLEKLHEQYGDRVTVLGFPANNFLWQEPGSNEEIAKFCEMNYGVSFPLFEKISVIGSDKHPLYQWLEAKSGEIPTWNFCKYLVDREGNVVGFFPAKVSPLDPQILSRLQ